MNIKKIGQISEVVESLVGDISITPYFRVIVLSIVSMIFLIAGIWLYRWNNHRVLRNAQVTLSECLFEYKRAQKDKNANWDLVVQRAKDGYTAHSGTALAPYFLLAQSDALLQKGDYQDALTCMAHAVDTGRNSVLSSLLQLRYALMLLDTEQAEEQEKGRQMLIALANDNSNAYQDAALYHLGRYYFIHDDFEKAKKTWTSLIDNHRLETTTPSLWALLAEQKASQIV